MTTKQLEWHNKGYNDQCWGYPKLDHVWEGWTLFWKPSEYPKKYQNDYRGGQVQAFLDGKGEKPWFHITNPKSMKEIIINGQTFKYKKFYDCSEAGDWEWTEFYKAVYTVKRKRWILFGKEYDEEVGIPLFICHFDIESTTITKSKLKQILEREVELLGRKQEILNGELI
jgi:hypothetical protein